MQMPMRPQREGTQSSCLSFCRGCASFEQCGVSSLTCRQSPHHCLNQMPSASESQVPAVQKQSFSKVESFQSFVSCRCLPVYGRGLRMGTAVELHLGLGTAGLLAASAHMGFCLSCSQVSAVPTVLAMKNGDVVDKFVGIKDEDQLEAFLKKLIGA